VLLRLLAKSVGMDAEHYAAELLTVRLVERLGEVANITLGELLIAVKAGRRFVWRLHGGRLVLAEMGAKVQ
jgi:hypothetical protein